MEGNVDNSKGSILEFRVGELEKRMGALESDVREGFEKINSKLTKIGYFLALVIGASGLIGPEVLEALKGFLQ